MIPAGMTTMTLTQKRLAADSDGYERPDQAVLATGIRAQFRPTTGNESGRGASTVAGVISMDPTPLLAADTLVDEATGFEWNVLAVWPIPEPFARTKCEVSAVSGGA